MSLFTHYTNHDGNFGIGKIPDDLKEYTSYVGSEFYSIIPPEKKQNMTYHKWYNDLPLQLKEHVNIIQKHPFWKQVCRTGDTCAIKNITGMDEIYYSKTPKGEKRGMLYGAAGNYDLHVDGVFRFPGIRFYRILIGLTKNNTTVETSFPRLKSSTYINKDDFIVFDFDRAQHKVINHATESEDEYRILLKLHFCVCDKCTIDSSYFDFVCKMYVTYEEITRYIMQTGTNPATWYQFFLGLLAWLATTFPLITWMYISLLVLYFVCLLLRLPFAYVIGRLLLDSLLVFLVLVTLFWIRYKLFKQR